MGTGRGLVEKLLPHLGSEMCAKSSLGPKLKCYLEELSPTQLFPSLRVEIATHWGVPSH